MDNESPNELVCTKCKKQKSGDEMARRRYGYKAGMYYLKVCKACRAQEQRVRNHKEYRETGNGFSETSQKYLSLKF